LLGFPAVHVARGDGSVINGLPDSCPQRLELIKEPQDDFDTGCVKAKIIG
jgi:hypothetical protein